METARARKAESSGRFLPMDVPRSEYAGGGAHRASARPNATANSPVDTQKVSTLRLFSALSHRPFALLWVGRSISSIGDGVYLIALGPLHPDVRGLD